jgi:hypothetical protein
MAVNTARQTAEVSLSLGKRESLVGMTGFGLLLQFQSGSVCVEMYAFDCPPVAP